MIRILIILILTLFRVTPVLGCCAEKDYRLFPIGELNNKIVFIEFDLFRNCRMGTGGEKKNEFWIKGTVNLMQNQGDSLILIQAIDTVNIKECTCTYKDFYENTTYETLLANSYEKALNIARQETGFQPILSKNIIFNDTLNINITEESTDTSYSQILEYKDIFTIDLGMEDIISCYPDKVAEVRTYETKRFQIIMIRLRCRPIEENAISYNKERFRKIETAFWKEQAQWHGMAKDYWMIKENNR